MLIREITLRGVVILCAILGLGLFSFASAASTGAPTGALSGAGPGLSQAAAALASPTPTEPPPKTMIMLPITTNLGFGSAIQLLKAWASDGDGNPRSAYLPGEAITYTVRVNNTTGLTLPVRLLWTLEGPCGSVVISDQVLPIEPGIHDVTIDRAVRDCPGMQTTTVEAQYENHAPVKRAFLVAITFPSAVAISNRDAFDKCSLPTLDKMQTWWFASPYYTFNVYLGGISFACPDPSLNAAWLVQAAQQGWSYILTWVGPQAPCSRFRYRMSSDPGVAYIQGRDEAELAAAAARQLGVLGDQVIYYDLESYSGASSSCRQAAASFLRGWTKRLHELKIVSGAYGAPCTSYMTDWTAIDPPPDAVWIAHWYTDYFDPDATVWDTPCLPNSLWVDHQRLKQYAGSHLETWGDLSMTIDSTVMDGPITAIPIPSWTGQAGIAPAEPDAASAYSRPTHGIQDIGLLSPETGWALRGGRLLWTADGGHTWDDLTPDSVAELSGRLLAATYLDARHAWALGHSAAIDPGSLAVFHSADGGATWQASTLTTASGEALEPVASASLDFVDLDHGWIALKLPTGSSFSLGRLFATTDGGHTWEERTLPLGEPVAFIDPQRGWVAGSPAGNQLYHTRDGGRTWEAQSLPLSSALLPGAPLPGQLLVGLPHFTDRQTGVLPVTSTDASRPALLLFTTDDGGESWELAETLNLDPADPPETPLPFSLGPDGWWWAARPGSAGLFAAAGLASPAIALPQDGLPSGVIALDFASDREGWALAQEGLCQGEKQPAGRPAPPGGDAFRCQLRTRLLATGDGGRTWQEITPGD